MHANYWMPQDARCLRKASECPCYQFFTPTPATPSSGSFSTCHLPAHLLDLSSGNLHQETPRYFGPKAPDVHLPGLQWVPWAVINMTVLWMCRFISKEGDTKPHAPLQLYANYIQTVAPMRKSGKRRQRTERTNDRKKEETRTRTSKHWAYSWHSRTNSLPKKRQYLYACM